MDKLEHIFELQKAFGAQFTDWDNLSEKKKQEKALDFINHTIEELIELRREFPSRKHWSSKKDFPHIPARALDEWVDVLHFFVSIALSLGFTADQVYLAYCTKNKVNHDRQAKNY